MFKEFVRKRKINKEENFEDRLRKIQNIYNKCKKCKIYQIK